MKEQWKRLDSDAKLLVNVEEGRSAQPLKIELPLSALRSSNGGDFCCNRVLTVLKVFVLLLVLVLLGWTGFALYSTWYPTESAIVIDNGSNEPLLSSAENKFAFRNKVYASHVDDNSVQDVVAQEVPKIAVEIEIEDKGGSSSREADELKSTLKLINDGMREISENIKNLNQITQGNIKAISEDEDAKEQGFAVNVENIEVDNAEPASRNEQQGSFNVEEWRLLAKEKIKEMARIQEQNSGKESNEEDTLLVEPVEITDKEAKPQLMFIDHLIRDLILIEDSKSASAEKAAENEEENLKKLVKTITESGESSEMFDKIENDDDLLSLLMYFYTKTDLMKVEDSKEAKEKEEKVDEVTEEEVAPVESSEDKFDQTEEDMLPVVPFFSLSSIVARNRQSSEESQEKEEPKVADESAEDSFEFPHLQIDPKPWEPTTTASVTDAQYDRDSQLVDLLARMIAYVKTNEVPFDETMIDYKAIEDFLLGMDVHEIRSKAESVKNTITAALYTKVLHKIPEVPVTPTSLLESTLRTKLNEMFRWCRNVEGGTADDETASRQLEMTNVAYMHNYVLIEDLEGFKKNRNEIIGEGDEDQVIVSTTQKIEDSDEVGYKPWEEKTVSSAEQYEIDRDSQLSRFLGRMIAYVKTKEVPVDESKIDYKLIEDFLFNLDVHEIRANARNVQNMLIESLDAKDVQRAETNDAAITSMTETIVRVKLNKMFETCRAVENDSLDEAGAWNQLEASNILYRYNYDTFVGVVKVNKDEIPEEPTTSKAEDVEEEVTSDSDVKHSSEDVLSLMASLAQMFKEPEESQEEDVQEPEVEAHRTIVADESLEKHTKDVLDAIKEMSQFLSTQEEGEELQEEPRVESSVEELTPEPNTENAKVLLKNMAELAAFIQRQTVAQDNDGDEEEEVAAVPVREYLEDDDYLRYPIWSNDEEDY